MTAKKEKYSKSNTTSSKPFIEVLEEDEYGMPIKYRDEIMALSKKVNKAVAKRWDEALAKRKDKKENI